MSSRIAHLGSRLLSRVLDVPPPTTDYTVSRVTTPMRDGVELLGSHYAPTGAAKGTLLVRCPYGRGFPFGPVFGAAYARRGYHVLVQSVRGTFGSGGEFEPMVNEIADAVDTAAWLRDQPWFTGSFATLGLSYLGFTQWALLTDPPPELKAAIISVGPHNFAESTWGTGAFTLDNFLSWSDMMAHQEEAPLAVVLRRFRAPRLVARTHMQAPAGAAARRLLGSGATWYESWLSHPDGTDPFWEKMALTDTLDKVDVPVLLIGGWQDLFLEQTLTQFQRLKSRGVPTAVTIGSWTHTQVMARGGATVLRESLAWLDTHLAERTPAAERAAVRVEVNGQGWLTMPDWPPVATDLELYLQPAHRLGTTAPADTAPPSRFTFDPAAPTPTLGGRLLSSAVAGYKEDSALSRRPDVIDFTGEPLTEDLYLIGTPVIELALSCDNPNRDIFVRLSEVDAKGRSHNVSDGFRRLTTPSDQPETLRLELDAVAHRIPAGSRLRVVVAGGCHPRYDRNLGTGEPVVSGERMVPATHTVHHGAGGVSRLLLPTVTLSAD